jgi:SulP family sulfate permease
MKRMSEETTVKGWSYVESENDADSLELRNVPQHVRVYEVSGPLFFGVADKILDVKFKEYTSCLVLRMRAVPAIDATAMNSLQQLHKKCESKGITLILSHVNEQPLQAMKKSGFYKKVGAQNFCAHIDEALKRAERAK